MKWNFRFLDLLLSNTSIEYIKLIVSSLNYSTSGFSRTILETALTATDDQSRKWCTRFLGVLAGSNVMSGFGKYGMKLMISQLGDNNIKVVRHAVRLLHVWLPVSSRDKNENDCFFRNTLRHCQFWLILC